MSFTTEYKFNPFGENVGNNIRIDYSRKPVENFGFIDVGSTDAGTPGTPTYEFPYVTIVGNLSVGGISTFYGDSYFDQIYAGNIVSTNAEIENVITLNYIKDIFDTTGSSGQTLISTPSGITWVNVEDIVSISTESYYSDISGISTISNRIDTTLTETDAVYYIPFVENPTSTSGEILRINGGLKYDPFTNNLGIGDTFFNSITPRASLDIRTVKGASINLLGVGTAIAFPGDRITIANEERVLEQSVIGFCNFLSPPNNRRWMVGVIVDNFYIQAIDDSFPGTGGGNRISIGRSDNQIYSLELQNDSNAFFVADFENQKIGIGSTTPDHNLDVLGDVYADTFIIGSGESSNVNESPMTIDASTTQRHSRIASFTSSRTLQISNLTPGREVKIYIRNTNISNRTLTVQASTTTSGFSNVNLSNSGTASVSSFTLSGSSGTAVIWVANIAGDIVGSRS